MWRIRVGQQGLNHDVALLSLVYCACSWFERIDEFSSMNLCLDVLAGCVVSLDLPDILFRNQFLSGDVSGLNEFL